MSATAASADKRRHLVVGTAGHIDHGKTTLLRALTGVDTDRLPEEKLRGISVDLGFASLTLDQRRSISFVDVPGHQHYLKNMLAGIGGVAAVMLIVSAQEGVKPQTREHFDICRLLGISDGFIVITKTDLVSEARIQWVQLQLIDLCKGSFLADKPVILFSAVDNVGLPALQVALRNLFLRPSQGEVERVMRLPIDRSFAVKGFGTVVTGSITDGSVADGESLTLQPLAVSTRVRGLERHGEAVPVALRGERVAVNLAGVEHTQIRRGMTLSDSSDIAPVSVLDARLEWLGPYRWNRSKRHQVLIHVGTAEIPAALKVLDESGLWARLWLSGPAMILPEDRFVLRQPSPAATVAGGVVLDVAPSLRRNRRDVVTRLAKFSAATWPERLLDLVEENEGGRSFSDLLRLSGLTPRFLTRLLEQQPSLTSLEGGQILSSAWLKNAQEQFIAWLTVFHREYPSLSGATMAQARGSLRPALARLVCAETPDILVRGDTVSLRSHRVRVNSEQVQALGRLEESVLRAGFQPPSITEVLASSGVEEKNGRIMLEQLIKANRLVRISDTLVFHNTVLTHIRTSLAAHKGKRFSVVEFKEWTQLSRKYAIPLLEYLDRQKVTRRDGDSRVIL